jgi:kynureninase
MEKLRDKSSAMTALLAQQIESRFAEQIEIITPSEPARRGCQLSLRLRSGRESGRRLFEHLETNGVLTDWREPDVIRVAPVPLYNRFEDCYALLQQISAWAEATGSPSGRSA